MSKRSITPAVLGISVLLLTGCMQSAEARVAGTAEYQVSPDAVGNTVNSINEVREALETASMRGAVRNNIDRILTLSQDLNTPFEFERDLFVCEELHPLPSDHGPEHPESAPLAACIEDTFTAHQAGQS
ncbi:hypothetical protein [Glutamicibacter sp.]|uniref:hypothetical protein n=1 Tax=Glutamicibacter sp. TaxID=1931995 RepID=UPI002FE320B1